MGPFPKWRDGVAQLTPFDLRINPAAHNRLAFLQPILSLPTCLAKKKSPKKIFRRKKINYPLYVYGEGRSLLFLSFAEVLIALSFWDKNEPAVLTPWAAGINLLPEKKGLPSYFPIILHWRSWDFLLPTFPAIPEKQGHSISQLSQRTRDSLLPSYSRKPGTSLLSKSQLFQRTWDFLLPNYPWEARTSYFRTI